MKWLWTMTMVVAVGCQLGDAGPHGERTGAVIGGEYDVELDSVGNLEVVPPEIDGETPPPFECTVTLVAPDIVLTAASCVEANVQAPGGLTVEFGASATSPTSTLGVSAVEVYRYYDGGQGDLALLRLDGEATGVTVADLAAEPLTDAIVGQPVTLVGFGVRDEAGNRGQRYAVEVAVNSLQPRSLRAGTDEATTCEGDGGAPVFLRTDDGPQLIAITSNQTSCTSNVPRARLDLYLDSFVFRYIDRFHGACPADDVCTETGCRSPDPDCDACAWNDTCEEDCPTRDWDCPPGSFVGDACTSDGGCEEGGACITAADDASFEYCSRPCDDVSSGCPADMQCTGGRCEYGIPSRGSQGWSCSASTAQTDCRSGICEEGICVFPCPDGTCPEDYTCGPSTIADGTDVCLGERLSGGGGFCAAAPGAAGSSAGPGMLGCLMIMLGLALGRRRRRS